MIQDAVYEHKNKGKITTYTFKKGYIMLKPIVDQFVLETPNAKCKKLTEWSRKVHLGVSLTEPTLSILGSPEVKGTYFHPSVVSQVLAWVSEDLKKKIFAVFENATVEQN